jgi:hypothetical protein
MASNNSKKPRRNPHSGRARGSEIKTGNRGAQRVRLDELTKVLLGQGIYRTFTPIGRGDR